MFRKCVEICGSHFAWYRLLKLYEEQGQYKAVLVCLAEILDRAEDDGVRIWEGYDEDDTEIQSDETETSLTTQIFEVGRKSKVIPQKKRIGRLKEIIMGKKEEPSSPNV